MSLGAQGLREGEWTGVVCPYDDCHYMLARFTSWQLEGCMEYCCSRCHRRSILGGPDHEHPARPQALTVTSAEAYREQREKAQTRKRLRASG